MTYSYAGLKLRVAAFALDYVLIALYIVVLGATSTALLLGPLRGAAPTWLGTAVSRDLLAFLTLVLPVALYFAVLESSAWQATWGKRRMGLRVVSAGGGRMGIVQSLVRSGAKLVPWQLTHSCLFRIPGWPVAPENPPLAVTVGLALVWVIAGAYAVSLAASKTHQTIYDRLAGSFVVAGHTLAKPLRDGRHESRSYA